MRPEQRRLCVSLHDVAPATLRDCADTLAFLDRLRIGPIALLVVPDYHGLGRADRDEQFCEFLRARERRGDEIVLHGFWHRDTASSGHNLRDWLERRVYTDGEGEFSRLSCGAARTRILRGLAILRAAGWHPRGFVAPAWLMSPGTRDALEGLPLQYCSTRDSIIRMGGDQRIAAPSLVASTRSAWRRMATPFWNQMLLRCNREAPLLRVALHPRDIRYPEIHALWRRVFDELQHRALLTEGQLMSRP